MSCVQENWSIKYIETGMQTGRQPRVLEVFECTEDS